MRMKLLILIIGVFVVISGVVAMSAWEAHVINVTAKIENALLVTTATGQSINFGTVFPQEYKEKRLSITTSDSFCADDQRRVFDVEYKIVQKPKPIWPEAGDCAQQFVDEDAARAYCHRNPTDLKCCYPSLCPYLSKTPVIKDPAPFTDYGVPAFHDPSAIATGRINKDHDLLDDWTIDLVVPCFEGMCSQDWPSFVAKHNPKADPHDYELPAELEGKTFGCDLWIEVTDIY